MWEPEKPSAPGGKSRRRDAGYNAILALTPKSRPDRLPIRSTTVIQGPMKRVGGMSRSLRFCNRYSATFADPMILVENMCPKHRREKN